jgi:Ca2+-binding EF-hand superfamily protein
VGFPPVPGIRPGELHHSIARQWRAASLDTMTSLFPSRKGAVMTTEIGGVQDRNIATVFSVLDANGNGTITGADLEAIGRQVCTRFGIDVSSEAGQKFLANYHSWWEQLRGLDGDGDGKVTFEEFAAAYQNGDPRTFFEEPLGRVAAAVAETIDSDDDGFITEDEYRTLLGIAVSDQESLRAGFEQLDTDGDGRITVAELKTGLAAVMLSNDPATPGTAMLGQA